jgi:Legionella pneumophila major outer membrane protein precursor
MRKQCFRLLVVGFLASQGVIAAPYDNCCASGGMLDQLCPGMGTLSLAGEALYWKPSFGGFDYAAEGVESSCSTVKTLKSDYDWGGHLSLRYLTPSECNFLQLSGMYISFSDGESVRGDDSLSDTFGQLKGGELVAGRLKIDYWWIDLRWAHYLSRGFGIEFYTYAGVRFAQFATRLRVDSAGSSPVMSERGGFGQTKADLRGVGPEIGVGGEYCLWGDLTLFGHTDMTALVSRRTYRQDTFNSGQDCFSRLRYSRLWGAVPALDTKLGLAYTYRCGGCFFRAQIGYELNYYWNVNKVRAPFTGQGNVQDGSFERTDRDLGFGGAFFGLTAGF